MAHKYGAKPTTVDGIRFASMAEAKRYAELLLLAKAGQVECLEIQPVYVLTVGERFIGRYIADFRYYDMRTGALCVEDVKGVKTPLYRWKKKHVEAQYGITITEVA